MSQKKVYSRGVKINLCHQRDIFSPLAFEHFFAPLKKMFLIFPAHMLSRKSTTSALYLGVFCVFFSSYPFPKSYRRNFASSLPFNRISHRIFYSIVYLFFLSSTSTTLVILFILCWPTISYSSLLVWRCGGSSKKMFIENRSYDVVLSCPSELTFCHKSQNFSPY